MMTTKTDERQSIETICAKADHAACDPHGSHVMPLYQTSTFRFKSAEDGRKFFQHEPGGATHSYSRLGNPTVEAVERVLAKIESVDTGVQAEGMLFGSGMAAITTGMMALASGKRILAQKTLYGCTSQFLNEEAPKLGMKVNRIDMTDEEGVAKALHAYDDIALVYVESMANPSMRVCDLEEIARLAHDAGAYFMVDNTFPSPYHMRPLMWGADLVAYSTTKYLNGHGTLVGGALVARNGLFEESGMPVFRKNLGGIAGPHDAWLTMIGLKTFPLRMERHSRNGMEVARFLTSHPKVTQVWYAGLEDHPDRDNIKKQMEKGYGGMISFELLGGIEAGIRLMDNVEVCTLAVSLGTIDTLIEHPASMTHAVMPRDERLEAGITDGMVRISVGLESVADIIRDLDRALLRV
jgi:methionine-gamma-lyase